MVNSLANHGFLPRNGLNVSLDQILTGFQESLNLDPNSTIIPATIALTTSTTGNKETLNLDDLSKHGSMYTESISMPLAIMSAYKETVIEHDGSLSRNDIFFGDNHSFNWAIWKSVSAFFTEATISVSTAAKARAARLKAAAAVNPEFNFTAQDTQNSLFETALYLRVFGNGTQGDARTEWVRILFGK